MAVEKESLVAAIQALYSRLQADALEPDDLIPLEQLTSGSHADLLARIYASTDAYDAILESFKETFDVFRVFDDRHTVLDVGAH